MRKLTAEWVRKAEADFVAANKLNGGSPPLHDQVCFHCQQSAEKYLKALLQEVGAVVPRTHILLDLLAHLLPHHAHVRSLRRGLDFLSRFAVATRYPGDHATKRQAEAALRWAEQTRVTSRAILGIRARRKKSR